MSQRPDDNILGWPVKIVPGGTLVSGDRPWILGPPLSVGGHTVNWVRLADLQPVSGDAVLVWTAYDTWFKATLHDGRFFDFGTGIGINNVTHWCEVTPPA